MRTTIDTIVYKIPALETTPTRFEFRGDRTETVEAGIPGGWNVNRFGLTVRISRRRTGFDNMEQIINLTCFSEPTEVITDTTTFYISDIQMGRVHQSYQQCNQASIFHSPDRNEVAMKTDHEGVLGRLSVLAYNDKNDRIITDFRTTTLGTGAIAINRIALMEYFDTIPDTCVENDLNGDFEYQGRVELCKALHPYDVPINAKALCVEGSWTTSLEALEGLTEDSSKWRLSDAESEGILETFAHGQFSSYYTYDPAVLDKLAEEVLTRLNQTV